MEKSHLNFHLFFHFVMRFFTIKWKFKLRFSYNWAKYGAFQQHFTITYLKLVIWDIRQGCNSETQKQINRNSKSRAEGSCENFQPFLSKNNEGKIKIHICGLICAKIIFLDFIINNVRLHVKKSDACFSIKNKKRNILYVFVKSVDARRRRSRKICSLLEFE